MKIKTVKRPLADVVEQFKGAFEQVSKRLVNRKEELDAVMFCMLCGGHLMLEGPPGVAKSLLARLAFKVIDTEDVVKYSITLMPNTQAEEVFGPMSIKELRENETIKYNTKGMLPSAHFAYINETYRGSDSILSTMMDILNEKTFFNGSVIQTCPLITAIGTTNFLSDKPELEAFHDRWLIVRQVEAADSGAARRAILELFLEDRDESTFEVIDPISLGDLLRLQEAVRKVEIPDAMKQLYEEMIEKYKSSVPNSDAYVSDRRYCQGIRLVQAAIMLEMDGAPTQNPNAQTVMAAKYAILRHQSAAHKAAMDNSITSTIGQYATMMQEEPEIKQFEDFAQRNYDRFDPKNPEPDRRKQLEKVKEVINRIVTLAPGEQFKLARNIERLKKITKKLTELKSNLEESLK